MNTLAGSYIFTGWLITRVVLADPMLVSTMRQIQALQDINAKLKTMQEEK